jgi:hypothetical protein
MNYCVQRCRAFRGIYSITQARTDVRNQPGKVMPLVLNFQGGTRTPEGSIMIFKFPFLLTNRKFVRLFNDSSTTESCYTRTVVKYTKNAYVGLKGCPDDIQHYYYTNSLRFMYSTSEMATSGSKSSILFGLLICDYSVKLLNTYSISILLSSN